jgi:aminoglycoside phosphotransferase (APT) family kinase protein
VTWQELPPNVRDAIERLNGSAVVEARTAHGGFSPGLASALTLADGRTVFAKAISDDVTPGAADLYRRERDVLRALPPTLPVPELLAESDDEGWVVLIYRHVGGRVPNPSRPEDLKAMLSTFEQLATLLTPSPISAPTFEKSWAWQFDSWSRAKVAADALAISIDPWISDNFEAVEATAAHWREATRGAALIHADLRADNMILTEHGIVVVDWPEACIAAPWLDAVLAAPSMAMFPGAPEPGSMIDNLPAAAAVEPDELTTAVAAMTGFFLCASVLPAIPALPTLRAFQREQGTIAASWLRRRMEKHRR